ncbi:hypothetical protein D5R81_11625 [Parashewanella spongiae]|uniref:Cardiolipin synthase N-terminal domain-containing protein n=1 Tax=Parashewanella spongiae TaxID=342950 RepID=A0A3A6TKY7_9GAMM|nr:hypothetical protein D5R81_11625 [Parashewanella spongiae]
MFDFNISTLITCLVIFLVTVHVIFALKPVISPVNVPTNQRILWSVLGFCFGAVGYYYFLSKLPFSIIVESHRDK